MTEIYQNISRNVKSTAETAWNLALAQKDPAKIASFLSNVSDYYSHLYDDEEMKFLQFYFHMKMEELRK